MQVFVPYRKPIEVARCLDPKRLAKQIQECSLIIDSIEGRTPYWYNHPVVQMYIPYLGFLKKYLQVLKLYHEGKGTEAFYAGFHLKDSDLPPFLTDEFCDQHKRRLYTKAPDLYPSFEPYGKSEENWYVVNGELVKYVNGKRI